MPLDCDESFRRLLEMFIRGLTHTNATGPEFELSRTPAIPITPGDTGQFLSCMTFVIPMFSDLSLANLFGRWYIVSANVNANISTCTTLAGIKHHHRWVRHHADIIAHSIIVLITVSSQMD